MRYTDACRISTSLEEDSYIYKDNIVEFATTDWETPGHTSCKMPDSTVNTTAGHVSHTKVESHCCRTRSVFKACKTESLILYDVMQLNVLQLIIHSSCSQGSHYRPASGMTYQTSFGCPSLLENSGKSHVLIPQFKRTVATLLHARENEASASCLRQNEILLPVESTKCASGLFFMRNFGHHFLQATCASGTSDMRDPRCGHLWSNHFFLSPYSWKQAGINFDVSDLLAFYAAHIGNLLRTFRDNLRFLFFNGQAVQDGADRMSRKVGDKLTTDAA